ncbi:MAG: thiamine pyrophosphate-binding protein, partial [Candidatus Limnocylindrales bacterium]
MHSHLDQQPDPQPVADAAEPEQEPEPVADVAEPEQEPEPVADAAEPDPQPVADAAEPAADVAVEATDALAPEPVHETTASGDDPAPPVPEVELAPEAEPEAEPEPAQAEPATVAELIAATLRGAGVRIAFTVPGESFLPVLDALEAAGVRIVATRHEGAAAFAAEAYGQLTGRPA